MARAFSRLTIPFLCLGASVVWAGESQDVITPEALYQMQLQGTELILWDARDKASFDKSHIQGAVLPLDHDFYRATELFTKGLGPEAPEPVASLKEATKDLDRNRLIVTYCNRNCTASQVLKMQLESFGFKRVKWMEAGLQEWEEKGYPVTIGAPKLRD